MTNNSLYQNKKTQRYYRNKDDVVDTEPIPPGLRICPMRPPRLVRCKDHYGYPYEKEQYFRCRSDCALFDTDRGCCGLRG